MKKYVFTLVFAVLAGTLAAQQVDESTAYTVAKRFYAQQQNHKTANELTLYCKNSGNASSQKAYTSQVYYYIFNDGNNGFVIVSGDKKFKPVLAYSTQGSFDTTGMPATIRWWMNGYAEQMSEALAYNPTLPEDAGWNDYLSSTPANVHKSVTAVAPLLSTTWNQTNPYNLLCPYDSTENVRCPTGCVATAMAQVMKYWNYPAQGSGSHSYTPEEHPEYGTQSANFGNTYYQWNNMTNSYSSSSSTAAKNAVATLMYHCGVAVEMSYGPDGSGAYTVLPDYYIQHGYIDARTAMKNNFKYAGATGYSRSSCSTAAWLALLKADLDKGSPVIYSGSGTNGGHCFVCDGYNSSDYFHFNWGWGGTSDGYFQVDALNPSVLGTGGGAGGFNNSQEIIVGLNPNDSVQVNHADIRLYSSMKVSPSTVTSGKPFSIGVKIANYGDSTYTGAYTIKLYDSTNACVGDVQVLNNKTLNGMRYDSAVFASQGMNLAQGTYIAMAYFYEDSTWKKIKDGQYTNAYQIKVVDAKVDMRLYSDITVTPTPVVVNKGFSVTAKVANYGNIAFVGKISADIFDEDIEYVGTLAELDDSISTNHAGNRTFTGNISLNPGNYWVYIFYQEKGSENWILVNNGKYTNGVQFTVQSDEAVNDCARAQAKVYPNPTHSMIHFKAPAGEETQVELIDITGKVLMRTTVYDHADIDLSGYAAGVYVLNAVSGTSGKNFRIIKQ